MFVAVINQDATDDVTAQITGVAGRGDAEVWTLNGPTFHAFNTPDAPDAVGVEKTRRPLAAGAFRHTFPAHSLTAIKFPAAR